MTVGEELKRIRDQVTAIERALADMDGAVSALEREHEVATAKAESEAARRTVSKAPGAS